MWRSRQAVIVIIPLWPERSVIRRSGTWRATDGTSLLLRLIDTKSHRRTFIFQTGGVDVCCCWTQSSAQLLLQVRSRSWLVWGPNMIEFKKKNFIKPNFIKPYSTYFSLCLISSFLPRQSDNWSIQTVCDCLTGFNYFCSTRIHFKLKPQDDFSFSIWP